MLITLLPFAALALLSAVVASPINGQDAKDVGFHDFPDFAGLGSLQDLVGGGDFESDADIDIDGDGETEGIEARAANQCTLAKLKKILFDYSITEFEAARNAKSPSCFNWDSDKCTLSPDRPAKFNFIPSCHRHDFGCTNFERKNQWNPVNKAKTDWNFRTDMLDECAKYKGWKKLAQRVLCTGLANKYAQAVFAFNPPTDL